MKLKNWSLWYDIHTKNKVKNYKTKCFKLNLINFRESSNRNAKLLLTCRRTKKHDTKIL